MIPVISDASSAKPSARRISAAVADGALTGGSRLVKTAFFGDTGLGGETLDLVYGAKRFEELRRGTDLYPTMVTSQNIASCLPELRDLEVIFATWGMIPLSEEQLDHLPALQAVFYAGGTIRSFALPLLRRGIIVTSSAAANALPAAEFTVAQILLANKGYHRNLREYRASGDRDSAFVGAGNYRATIALLGAGQIGRKVIEFLQPFEVSILVFDPFLSLAETALLGVEKVDLATAFARGRVVSNHLADLPTTAGMIDGKLLSSMPQDATFINTGRGRTVHGADLIAVMRARSDLTALLDVTEPEPLPKDSGLWALPNVSITSHIAGSKGGEIERIADFAIEEFKRWNRGKPLRHAVSLESLERMA